MGYKRNPEVGARMNTKEVAGILNNRDIGDEIPSKEFESHLKSHGIIVVFGASDDLIEFKGAIGEELGVCDGTKVKLNANGLLLNECDNDICPYFAQLMNECAFFIEALWCNGDISWTYKTNIPHETFDIMEDGEIYGRGIVFSLRDLII